MNTTRAKCPRCKGPATVIDAAPPGERGNVIRCDREESCIAESEAGTTGSMQCDHVPTVFVSTLEPGADAMRCPCGERFTVRRASSPLNNDERDWLAMLRKRQAHLRARIVERRAPAVGTAPKSTSYDVKEADALAWVIREVTKARHIVEITPGTENGPIEITHRRKPQ